jgi:phage shock protein PspC (stress-responsive transcriptional regulator)
MDEVTPPTDDTGSAPAAPEAPEAAPEAAPEPTPEPAAAPGPRRLHRSSSRRLIGGVAGGLGERFDLDANIFRVGFVLLSIAWGLGVLVYLALWIIMPRDPNGEAAAAQRAARAPTESNWSYLALSVALIFVALLAWSTFGRHHTFGHGPAVGRDLFLLWILFLVVLAFIALRSPARRMSLGRVVAVFLLCALTLVIVVAGGILTYLAATGVPLTGGTGAHDWAPTSLTSVQHSYRTEFGTELVDLSAVKFPAAGYEVATSVSVGTLRVVIPDDVVLDVRTRVGAGSVSYGIQEPWGFFGAYFSDVPATLRASQVAKAPHLTLDAQVGLGVIEIAREGPKNATQQNPFS